jgi:hypothetical protein
MRQLIGCICDEMKAKACIGAALTFKCPKHGQITVDMRVLPLPISYPIIVPNPLTQPFPYTPPDFGDPPITSGSGTIGSDCSGGG